MSVRRGALDALNDIVNGAYANLRLQTLRGQLSERDARWASALVYGTLDHLLSLDFLIDAYCAKRPKPALRGILRLGLSETLYFGTPVHAAVSSSVDLCRECGLSAYAGFINAVLRRADRERSSPPPLPEDPEERLSIQYSFPRWLVKMWLSDYGETFTEALLASLPQKTQFRAQYPCDTNTLLNELPVSCTYGRFDSNCLIPAETFNVTAHPAFSAGRMTIQSESAMLVCRALGNCREKRVLDACAAPGGKSAYIASLSENTARLTCWEKHPHRVALLINTLARLHVEAAIEERDASIPLDALCETFDAVLVDAPCSGLGLISDKPDIRYRKTDADIESLAAVQRDLLNCCANYVHVGGVLVYATCTISRRENEDVVRTFLAEDDRFLLERMDLPLENDGMLQLYPHIHGTDGFFLARCIRCK